MARLSPGVLICQLLAGLFMSVLTSYSQDLSEKYDKYIDTVDLRRHLTLLASDAFEGRKTAEAGQQKAAAYLKEEFSTMGCAFVPGQPGYAQPFPLVRAGRSGKLQWGDTELAFPADFGFGTLATTVDSKESSVLYFPSLELLDQQADYSQQILVLRHVQGANGSLLKNIRAKGLIWLADPYDERMFIHAASTETMGIHEKHMPVLYMNRQSLDKTLSKQINKADKKGSVAVIRQEFTIHLNPHPPTENVLAYVEGSDPVLKNEIIVISAHYDHLGVKDGEVYNGADDNGSGTSGLLELAQAFQEAARNHEQPKRSYLFIALTGEEMGLLGSEHYVNHPWIPLSQTITDLNIDMIGRITDSVAEQQQYSVCIIGSNLMSDDLHSAHQQAHRQYSQLQLDYTYNNVEHPMKLYFRSDHYNFAKNGVPSIFYFGGFHMDYHQSTDDVEVINFEKLRQISSLVFHTAWILGNAENRPAISKP
jgi:hypothetical protein